MPRKLGQHFLVRDAILEKLAIAVCGESVPRLIEIGPGRGALTRHLLPHTGELHVIEIDTSFVAFLRKKFAAESKLHIHEGDVLESDLTQWGAAAITGNLPYYITSPIIRKFLELDNRFACAVFLMQWEVAERLLASSGTRAYGFLTVAAQLFCHLDLVCRVPAAAFAPPPQVDSGAVLFRRKPEIFPDRRQLLTFVSRCFMHKRKTLRNNLRGHYGGAIDALPEASLRAEQLSLQQFIDLYSRLTSTGEPFSPLSYTDTS